MNAKEMDIHSLDCACADMDIATGYIRKIIVMIPSIVEKIFEEYYGQYGLFVPK